MSTLIDINSSNTTTDKPTDESTDKPTDKLIDKPTGKRTDKSQSGSQSDEVALESGLSTLSIEEIQALLPHRYPFLLVDRITEYVPGRRAVGIKNVTFNEPHFQGHFPGQSIMPGVLIVEAMAQVGGIVLTQMLNSEEEGLFLFAGIDKVRFRRQVVPGDQLVMTVELVCIKQRRYGKMQARAEVNGKLATEGNLSFSLVLK